MPRVIAAGLVGMLLGMLLGGLLGGLPLFGIAQGDIRQRGEQVVARVVRVVDGDTFRATIADWPKVVGENIPVRVAGVDAPEPRGKCQAEKDLAEAARAFLEALIGPDKQVELLHVQRGAFFPSDRRGLGMDRRRVGECGRCAYSVRARAAVYQGATGRLVRWGRRRNGDGAGRPGPRFLRKFSSGSHRPLMLASYGVGYNIHPR